MLERSILNKLLPLLVKESSLLVDSRLSGLSDSIEAALEADRGRLVKRPFNV